MSKFNIRVYGLWIHEGKVLVNEEIIRGKVITKFPGGGLEWGEGVLDCLKREWMEELGLTIDIEGHYYTTDYFQPSAYDDSQIISIYYRVSSPDPTNIVNLMDNERTYWLPLKEITEHTFTLPIDKKVGIMIAGLGVA